MLQKIVVAIVCLGLLGVGAMVLSASPGGRNIFAASDESSCSKPSTSNSAGFVIAGGKALGEFDWDMSGVCQGACAAKQDYEASQVVAQPGARPGDLTQCPVSGVVFVVAGGRPVVQVGDDAYHLCCDGCADKFRVNPARFVRL